MTARELLYALWARGAILEPEAGRLRCRYPSGKVPDDSKGQSCVGMKAELLALLGRKPVEEIPLAALGCSCKTPRAYLVALKRATELVLGAGSAVV